MGEKKRQTEREMLRLSSFSSQGGKFQEEPRVEKKYIRNYQMPGAVWEQHLLRPSEVNLGSQQTVCSSRFLAPFGAEGLLERHGKPFLGDLE